MSLKQQAKAGLFWTFLQQFGAQLISFGISVVLARLLLPEDFGIVALFGVVVGVATSLIDGGLASSLIRTQDIDDTDNSTVFIFNVVASFVMYAVVFATAPWVAAFFELDILTPIIRVYSILLIITAFTTVQRTHFVKKMDFKTDFKIQLPSSLIGGIAGIIMAYSGFGVWSLILYPILQNFIVSIQYWLYSSWRPKWIFNKQKFKYHFNYGYKLTLSGLLNTLFQNVYTIIIGKMFSPAQLGYYNRASSLKQLPVSNLSAALNKVTFPLFAKISNDDTKLKEVYQKLMQVVVFVIAPILCIMIVVAEPMIRFLLTEKWLPTVPYLQLLAVSGILYPIHSYNLNVLKVKGRTDLFLKLEVWKKVLIICILFISVRYGIIGIIWGQLLGSFIAFFINSHYTGRLIAYGAWSQIKDLLPTLILAGITSYLMHLVDKYFLYNDLDILRISLLSIGYLSIFLSATWLLKFNELKYIKELLRK